MPGMMRRRARRRAIVGTAVVAGGVAHHMANKNSQAQADAEQQALDAQAAQQQAAPVATAGPTGSSQIDELTRLAGLRDQGVLTNAEFDAQKAKILGG
jgi:hypothetical protein